MSRGFTQDGDSGEFQPPYEDNMEDFLSSLSEIADLLRKANQQDQSLTTRLAFLSQEVETEIARTEALKNEVEELDQLRRELYDTDSLEPLQSQIEELSEEWKVIVEKRQALESGHNIQGDLGMVAVYVEQAMCAYVLPEVFLNDDNACLHKLLNYLNGKDNPLPLSPDEYDCESILSSAKKRWEIVCKNFSFPDAWKSKTGGWMFYDCSVPGDLRAIEVLKMGGVSLNFPSPISLKYAEQNVESMKEELPVWQFNLVAEFIWSLRDKITKTGLHHKHLILD